MDTLLEAVLDSPLLPQYVASVNRVLTEEQARRERFYEEMTEDDKWEFINGEIVMHSPAKWSDAEAVGFLSRLLGAYVDQRRLGSVAVEKAMVSLSRNDYEPDIVFFRREVADSFTPDQMRFPAPDLIAEILSPSTAHNDRGIKNRDYAAHGVGEYWIVDPVEQTIEQYVLKGAHYEPAARLSGDAEIESATVCGFRIPALAVFDRQANVAALASLLNPLPTKDP